MADYQTVLDRFECVRPASRPNKWNVRCPNARAHKNGDRKPSACLWVNEGNGRLYFSCAKRCYLADVWAATGTTWRDWCPEDYQPKSQKPKRMHPVYSAIYDYVDAEGELLYQVCRKDGDGGKNFHQRRPMPGGEWAYSLAAGWYARNSVGGWERAKEGQGIELPEARRVLYRLPELRDPEKAAKDWPVIVAEGEKNVEALRTLGMLATTNSGGAGKWLSRFAVELAGRRVVVIADADEPGTQHADAVAGSAARIGAKSVRVWSFTRADCGDHDVPEGFDVSDWLAALPVGHLPPIQQAAERRSRLSARIKQIPEWKPS